ncbi:MAG: DUF2975 domain-containing protein [Oscillospiraceae bacterium]|nr:DUF2975 domain-containing protein [Oscillospiraceae bacterium]
MNWDKDKSILLSQIGTVCFAVLLLVLDVSCWWVTRWIVANRLYQGEVGAPITREVTLMMVSILTGSVLGWIFLHRLWTLLQSIKGGAVFTAANVSRMRAMSWCCMGAAAICLASALYYLPFLLVGLAAGFTGLIVRVVKNVFQQAIAMKDELDLTV